MYVYIQSHIIYIESYLICIQSNPVYIQSHLICIQSHLLYNQPHLILFNLLFCIQSHVPCGRTSYYHVADLEIIKLH